MRQVDRWVSAHPVRSSIVLGLAVAAITLLISGLFHPDGLSHGLGKLWLTPLVVLLHLVIVRPASATHRRD